ncbi:MAG: hypothetical protein QM664_12510, partial [Flavihumibacter sp.]
RWQPTADENKWPSFEIFPANAWNYGLYIDKYDAMKSFSIRRHAWPKDNNPFTNVNAPVELTVKGKAIPSWTLDQYKLCGVLPQSPVTTSEPVTELTLVPMGGSRLRISAFPVVN